MTEKHDYNLNKWKLLIENRINSGMTVESWCNANGYTKHAYYYWLSLIRKESYDKAVSNLPSTLPVNESHSIVEISKTDNRIGCAGIHPTDHPSAVIRKDSVCIDIYPDIEPLLLNRLVEALNYAQT